MKIIQNKISDKHTDSIWYDGLIAENDNYELVVMGDVAIYDKDGLVYDGYKERNNGFDFKFENDDDLCKIGNNYDDKYYWEHNNWFEIIDKRNGDECGIYHDYDDAIHILKNECN